MLHTVLLVLMLASDTNAHQSVHPTLGKIEILHPDLEVVVDPTTPIEVLTDRLQWAEGPVWVDQEDFLLFTDPEQNIIFSWDADSGVRTFLTPSGYTGRGAYSAEPGANGLLINQQGELVICEHGDRRVTRMPLSDGGKVRVADAWQGKRFNSPNDICQHSDGSYWFTDPPYGLPRDGKEAEYREIEHNGVYRVGNDGEVVQIIDDLKKPNGIALSPDEKWLYVAQSDAEAPYIMAYPLDGTRIAGEGKVFYDFSVRYPGIFPDGIKVDREGRIFAGAGEGLVVLSEDGELLGRFYTGVQTANCAFGADYYMYITASQYVLRLKLK